MVLYNGPRGISFPEIKGFRGPGDLSEQGAAIGRLCQFQEDSTYLGAAPEAHRIKLSLTVPVRDQGECGTGHGNGMPREARWLAGLTW